MGSSEGVLLGMLFVEGERGIGDGGAGCGPVRTDGYISSVGIGGWGYGMLGVDVAVGGE